jgi:hypothetical protein
LPLSMIFLLDFGTVPTFTFISHVCEILVQVLVL